MKLRINFADSLLYRRGGFMEQESQGRSISEEVPGGYVENVELAQKMAGAEKRIRDQLEIAKQLGLSSEKINQLAEQANETGENTGVEYKKAMDAADDNLFRLIQARWGEIKLEKPEEVDFNELLDAIYVRIQNVDKEGKRSPKNFQSGGKTKNINLNSKETPNSGGAKEWFLVIVDAKRDE